RHLIILSLIFYAATLAIDHDMVGVAATLAAISAVVFAVAALAPERVDKIVQLGGRLPLHALIGFLAGMALIQIERIDGGGFAVSAAIVLAGIAAAIVLAGRNSRGVRWLAYLAFALELCLIYVVT